jgi:hypothetical protein
MEPWQRTLSNGSRSIAKRHRRRLLVVGVAALMLALPLAVSASHIFSDVPTSSTYHTTTSRLVGAGITGGCGGGKYCPNDPVTRGQMAAFLNRGLGRAMEASGLTEDDHWASLLPTGLGAPAVDYLTIGGGAGGTAHVLVQGNLAAFTDEAGVCPCEIVIALLSEVGEISTIGFQMIGTDPSPSQSYYEASASISHLFTVPSGTLVGFALLAQITPTTNPSLANVADAFFSLQATYVPFTANGGNPPLPVVTAGKPDLPFGSWPFGDHKIQ